MSEQVVHLNTVFQVRRGESTEWTRVNPILRDGEPGFEVDTGLLKIGSGKAKYSDLPYINDGESIKINTNNANGLNIGVDGLSLNLASENTAGAMSSSDKKLLGSIPTLYNAVKFELVENQLPSGYRVTTRDDEIRIMFPSDTKWIDQTHTAGADPNRFYMGLRLFAPTNEAIGFKRGEGTKVKDEFIECTVDGDTGGIDKYGRKFYIIWLPIAEKIKDTWKYFGRDSTEQHYIGWYITVEWYKENPTNGGKAIASETIRVNLSNEECHNNALPYYGNSNQTSVFWGKIR